MSKPGLNLAGQLAHFFIDSKLTPMLVVAVLIFGTLSLVLTPREENPQIVVPAAQVTVALPGVSAREVEALILTPLEAALSSMPEVKHTFGTAADSIASVQVEFEVGVGREVALTRVYDRVAQARSKLPSDAGEPVVTPIDSDDVPVVSVTLASAEYDDYALKRMADRMAERLRSLRGVSVVSVHGGRDREIRVEVDPERMHAFGVTLDQGLAQLAGSNVGRPIGDLARLGQRERLYVEGRIDSAAALGRLVIGERGGRLIYLDDVAQVVDGPPEVRRGMARLGFGPAGGQAAAARDLEMPAVTVAVAKKAGENAVSIASDVLDRVHRMQREFVPASVHVVTTRDDGVKANDAVNLLVEHLGIAIITVVATLLLTLGLREGLMVLLVVPLVMLTVVMADGFAGVTLNRVALFGLILALGSLVDDAIVVVENIHRHYTDNPGGDRRAMAVEAVAEIGSATNFATFSMMAVFSAMIVVSGMQGEFFYPIIFNLPTAMLTSLIFAYVVTPWTAHRWLRPKPVRREIAAGSARGASLYDRVLCQLLDRASLRLWLFGIMGFLIFAAVLMPAWQFIRASGPIGERSPLGVLTVFLPRDNNNTFNIFVDLPEHGTVEQTDAVVREIGTALRAQPEVKNYLIALGQPGVTDLQNLLRGSLQRTAPNMAELRVNLVHRSQRKRWSIDVVNSLRPQVYAAAARVPGTTVRFFDDPPGPPVRAKVLAEVYGADDSSLRAMAAQVRQEFENTPGMAEVYDSDTAPVRQHLVRVDKEKAALSGIATRQIQDVLTVLFEGITVGRVHLPDERNAVPIRIEVPRRFELDPTDLDRIYVTDSHGRLVAVSDLTHLEPGFEDRPILHKDNERVVFVGGEYLTASGLFAVMDLNRRLEKIRSPDGAGLTIRNLGLYDVRPDTVSGTQLLWEGETRMLLDSYRDMGFALLLAISLVYLMLVAYYRSFLVPVIALAALPLAFIGVFPGHWLFGAEFSGASMIGIIALVGMVVRASLLIIEFAREAEAQGAPLREALRQACALRLRPIVLTSLTNILGATVMLLDPVFRGLALSVIFGTISATVLTMVVVPALYISLDAHLRGRRNELAPG